MDGERAYTGTPSILDLSGRRALNLAYHVIVRNMDHDEHVEFDESLNKSMLEWALEAEAAKVREIERRRRLAESLGEVAK